MVKFYSLSTIWRSQIDIRFTEKNFHLEYYHMLKRYHCKKV
jgi:hypothetical protein